MKLLKLLLLFTVCLAILTACGEVPTYSGSYEDGWLEGIEYGRGEVFESLWYSAELNEILFHGELWETNDFAISFSDKKTAEGMFLTFDLTLKNFTITECFEESKMFFNIYSVNDSQWDMVLGYDNYFDYALFEHLEDNNGKGSIGIYDDVERLAIIIVIDGSIYKATYEIS